MLILFVLVTQFDSRQQARHHSNRNHIQHHRGVAGLCDHRNASFCVMTGLGIVGLAGIVVKNGILVIEFTDELRARGMKTREALIQAGKTRIIPVLLTALAAILALIPSP